MLVCRFLSSRWFKKSRQEDEGGTKATLKCEEALGAAVLCSFSSCNSGILLCLLIHTGLVLYSDGMSSLWHLVEWNDNGNDSNLIPRKERLFANK